LKKGTTAKPSTERPEPLFATSKKDKRRIKHAQLMSKVTKSTVKPRRRRPKKALIATLNSLADALPDEGEGDEAHSGARPEDQVNIIRRKSMKSRPGALKRREKLDKSERDRFAKNMAQMAGSKAAENGRENVTPGSRAASGSEKWAALRSFISQTLEQRPDIKTAPS
jgi:Ribosome biogenesis protein SLX9